MIERVVVVIPAKDEADLLPGCLEALAAARRHLRARHPGVQVDPLVVLDGCRDASAAVVARHGISVLACDLGRVGAVRHLGAAHLLAGYEDLDATWLACTDADSLVPPTWLSTQVDLADEGADVVVGTVEPVGPIRGDVLSAWHDRHDLREDHAHVHGANLGIRASTYVDLGGFAPLALHEDAVLVGQARATAGVTVVATDRTRVGSSARGDARCAGGFASYLRDLETEVS